MNIAETQLLESFVETLEEISAAQRRKKMFADVLAGTLGLGSVLGVVGGAGYLAAGVIAVTGSAIAIPAGILALAGFVLAGKQSKGHY